MMMICVLNMRRHLQVTAEAIENGLDIRGFYH